MWEKSFNSQRAQIVQHHYYKPLSILAFRHFKTISAIGLGIFLSLEFDKYLRPSNGISSELREYILLSHRSTMNPSFGIGYKIEKYIYTECRFINSVGLLTTVCILIGDRRPNEYTTCWLHNNKWLLNLNRSQLIVLYLLYKLRRKINVPGSTQLWN